MDRIRDKVLPSFGYALKDISPNDYLLTKKTTQSPQQEEKKEEGTKKNVKKREGAKEKNDTKLHESL